MSSSEHERREALALIERARGALDKLRHKIETGDDCRVVQDTYGDLARFAGFHTSFRDGREDLGLTIHVGPDVSSGSQKPSISSEQIKIPMVYGYKDRPPGF